MNFGILCLLCLELLIGLCYSKRVKIINGEDASIKDFKYQVSFRTEDTNFHFCGGAIISRLHVLTVAHCLYNKMLMLNNIRIYTGSSRSTTKSGNSYEIKNVHVYKDYDPPSAMSELQRHDIAIIEVDKPIIFNIYQRKVLLPTKDVTVGDTGVVSGWGLTTFPSSTPSELLQKLSMRIFKKALCEEILIRKLHEEHFCAYDRVGTGTCIGDSGGPLVSEGKLIGLMTYIIPCGKGYPDIFINVYHYLDFIKSIIEK